MMENLLNLVPNFSPNLHMTLSRTDDTTEPYKTTKRTLCISSLVRTYWFFGDEGDVSL